MKKRFILSVAVIAILMVLCLFTACMDFNNPDEIENPDDPDNSPNDFTELTLNLWSDGVLTSEKKEQWFKFTATAVTQYFHFKKGTLDGAEMELYKGKNTAVSDTKKSINDGNNILYSVTSGQTYYIKVTPQWSKTGTYKIGFTTSTSSPDTLAGVASAVQLTINTWSESSFTLIDNEKWFKFTATATAPQYIHFKEGTLKNGVYVQLYNSSHNPVDTEKTLYDGNSTNSPLTMGQLYYIKVTPRYSNGTGTFNIGFTALEFSPDTVTAMNAAVPLSINTWSDGTISLEVKEQWFRFTASATNHYIHFKTGTLNDVWVQLFNSSGLAVDTRKNLYGSTLYTSSPTTSGQIYYIRVMPDANKTGAYKIGYNTSATAPSS